MNSCTELDDIWHEHLPQQTSRMTDLYNAIEFPGYTSFLVFFCVHDAAATRGQYLALSRVCVESMCCVFFCYVQKLTVLLTLQHSRLTQQLYRALYLPSWDHPVCIHSLGLVYVMIILKYWQWGLVHMWVLDTGER